MPIPRIIYQTINDKSKLDELVVNNIQKLKTMNSGWDHRVYDEVERHAFVASCYGDEMLSYYDRIDPRYGAARADFFRYLLVYEHGGVYVDIKSAIHKPLDEILHPDDEYLLSRWRNGPGESYEDWGIHPNIDGVSNEYQQWHVIASPRHPFLKAVIERVRSNIDRYTPFSSGVGKTGVMRLTGPIAYTAAIQPIQTEHRHRVVDIEALGFQYSIMPSTKVNKYGHIALFKNHYSTLVDPIVMRGKYGPVEGAILGALTGYRLAHRATKNLAKQMLGRTKD